MSNAQIYCTLQELIDDLSLNGDERNLFSRIQAASRFIQRRFGNFIPITDSKIFGARTLSGDLYVDPLLAVTALTNDGATIASTQYDLLPYNRRWENGPYTRLHSDLLSWSEDDVDISGRWGKYEATEAVSVSAVTQLLADTTLVVTDGSQCSPGMVVLVESEQELVTGFGAATAATSLLNGALDASQEEITVDNGAEFKRGEVIQLSSEDCHIRMVRGNVLVCARGYNGTTKTAHADDLAISVCRTFTVTRGVNGTTAIAHANKALSRYLVPEDVNWLCRQIAGLMRMKAASGFAGKTGNAELGETFYHNEFPSQIKDIERNYRIVSL